MIGDIKRTILSIYKADTSQMKREIGELQDKTKKLGDESKKTATDFDKLVSLGSKAAGALGAAKIVIDGFNSAIERSRLTAASAGANIDRLRSASLGLKTEMQLLADAAQFQSGAFKLNQQQMEVAERAMVAFGRKGAETAKAQKAVTDAVVELKTDGLADLGVFVDKTGLSMDSATDRAKLFERTMQALAKAGADVKEGQLTAAEGAQAAAARLDTAWTKLKQGLGDLAIAFTPVLDALARAVDLAAQLAASQMPGEGGAGGFGVGFSAPVGGNVKIALAAARKANARRIASDPAQLIASIVGMTPDELRATEPSYQQALSGYLGGFGSAASGVLGRIGSQMRDPWASERGGSGAARGGGMNSTENIWAANYYEDLQSALIDMVHNISTAISAEREAQTSGVIASASSALGMSSTDGDNLRGQLDAFNASGEIERRNAEAYKEFAGRKSDSYLEKTFGPLEDISGYTMAFQALSGAVGSALSAWIDGSMSAGDAVKKFIAETMKANAILMAAEAIKEGAYALGKLAIGDAASAATHGASALKFGLAAAAFAGGAKALGSGGGATGGAGAGSAAPTYNASASTGATGNHPIVVIGNNFTGEDSPRQRQLWAERMVNQAKGSNAVVYS